MAPTKPNVGTITDIADAYHVSEATIRRRIHEGVLPVYRLGARSIRIAYEDAAVIFAGTPSTYAKRSA